MPTTNIYIEIAFIGFFIRILYDLYSIKNERNKSKEKGNFQLLLSVRKFKKIKYIIKNVRLENIKLNV